MRTSEIHELSSSDSSRLRSSRGVWLALAVALLAIGAYWPALSGGFIWDDDSYVTANPAVTGKHGLARIWGLTHDADRDAWVSSTPQYYPIVFTSFRIEHACWGLDPRGYHVTNLALHLLGAFLLYRLLARLAVPGAAFVAALFALHPIHVESVAWITERKNVLSGVFYLSAFWAYVCFDATHKRGWYAASLALFSCALLSKSVTATLPLAIVIALLWKNERVRRRDVLLLVPFVALGTLSGWFTAYLERVKVGATGTEFDLSFFERALLVAPRAFGFYAEKAAWPHPITFVYERFEPHFTSFFALVPLIVIGLAVMALFLARRTTGRGPLCLVALSGVTLAPALGFVPVFPHRFSWVADHFAYLGSIGFFVLLAASALALVRLVVPEGARHRANVALGACALVACAWRTNVEARSYESAERLWTDTLAESPNAWIAMINLGIEYMKGASVSPERKALALELFQRAEQYPLGALQAATNQGQWMLQAQRTSEARACFRRALAIDRSHGRARAGLAETLSRQISLLIDDGKHKDALGAIRMAMLEIGTDPAFVRMSAWLEATSGDELVRNGPHARKLAQDLVARDASDFQSLDALAAAEAACGDFDAARASADRALTLAKRAHRAQVAAGIQARLDLYRAGRPFVQPAR